MKKNFLKGAAASVIILSTVAFKTITKQLDVKASEVHWKGEKVTGSHQGTINFSDGHLNVDGDKILGGEFLIDMSSINVTDLEGDYKQKLEGHLKSDDFFGVENHPTAKLVITNASKKSGNTYGVVGDLTIKGKTQPITFDLNWEGDTATANLSVDRTKYDVRYGSGSFFDNLGDKTIYDNFDLKVTLKF